MSGACSSLLLPLLVSLCLSHAPPSSAPPRLHPLRWYFEDSDVEYPSLSSADILDLREQAREAFTFGYDNYLQHAFPDDELDPIHCSGRGPDYEDPSNININDVLGDYCLTLIDALDTLAVLGNVTEFHRAVRLVTENVSFEKDNTVQVFEATIRVLGGLLSAHFILTDNECLLGDFRLPGYDNELLTLARELATRLVPAFEGTTTGIPYPRVNLMYGVPWNTVNETATAGAGSLLLEFGVLTRLLNDPTFEGLARRTNAALWNARHNKTGLLGSIINVQSGAWIGRQSGLGAGLDSFYEYLLKAYILFGDDADYRMFNESYSAVKEHMRLGRERCAVGLGDHPLYVNVDLHSGNVHNTWIDSMQAAFAGVQVLIGDIDEAVCAHALYYNIWKKYGVIPERYNWKLKAPDVLFYPLRPEFAESTYFLYSATKNPFYLHVGREILESLNRYTKVKCGYATVHNVHDMSLEDRMESFFLSETCKYLYLLFDIDNPVNQHLSRFVFTTEGHIFPVNFRRKTEVDDDTFADESDTEEVPEKQRTCGTGSVTISADAQHNISLDEKQCPSYPTNRLSLPLEPHHWRLLAHTVGIPDRREQDLYTDDEEDEEDEDEEEILGDEDED